MTSGQPVTYASGIDRSGAVLGLGLLLMVVNFLFTPEGSGFWDSLIGTPPPAGTPTVKWQDVLLQFVFLFLLVLLAKADDEAGTVALLFVGALWVVWLFNNTSSWLGFLHAGSGEAPHPQTPPDLKK